MSDYQDESIVCKDCGNDFTHSAGEQEWMRNKWGDDYKPPVRCKSCRNKRKDQNK